MSFWEYNLCYKLYIYYKTTVLFLYPLFSIILFSRIKSPKRKLPQTKKIIKLLKSFDCMTIHNLLFVGTNHENNHISTKSYIYVLVIIIYFLLLFLGATQNKKLNYFVIKFYIEKRLRDLNFHSSTPLGRKLLELD